MINEHDITDMLPELAKTLVLKSSGMEVPDAALPSLVEFMQEVAEHCAFIADTLQQTFVAKEIRSEFGLKKDAPCILLQPKKIIHTECGK